MTCERDIDLVAYAKGELAEGERRELRLHVAKCESCRRELEGIEKVLNMIRSVEAVEPSSEFSERFKAAMAEAIAAEERALTQRGFAIVILASVRRILTSIPRTVFPSGYRVPAWVVSAVVHVLLLAVLSYIFIQPGRFSVYREFTVDIEPMGEVSELEFSPRQGSEIKPAALASLPTIEVDREDIRDLWTSMASPPASLDVEIPEHIPLEIPDWETQAVPSEALARKDRDPWASISGHVPISEWFGGNRRGERRKIALAIYGGSAESESAVRLALDWLKQMQKEDGSWSASETGGKPEYDIAVSSLVLLTFLGRGNTHKEGVDSYFVKKGIEYLQSIQMPSGLFGGAVGHYMYGQGIAALALLEDYAMTADEEIGKHAKLAVEFILRAQNADGGWGYTSASLDPVVVSDSTVTAWQIMALRTAAWAGLKGVDRALERAGRWLNSVTTREGYVGYQSADTFPHGKLALTSVGLVCRYFLGYGDKDVFIPKQAEYISMRPPAIAKGEPYDTDMYTWYHATLGMFFRGGKEWKEWNEKMQKVLLSCQSEDGSWSLPDKWSRHGGRIYSTAMAVLTLQTYYRYTFQCL